MRYKHKDYLGSIILVVLLTSLVACLSWARCLVLISASPNCSNCPLKLLTGVITSTPFSFTLSSIVSSHSVLPWLWCECTKLNNQYKLINTPEHNVAMEKFAIEVIVGKVISLCTIIIITDHNPLLTSPLQLPLPAAGLTPYMNTSTTCSVCI